MHDGHDHPHHTHEHTHTPAPADGGLRKNLALLTYMLEHNRSHADELRESGEKLHAAGQHGAAHLIFDAVHDFEHGNEKLEAAIKAIREEL